jgi:hypothetical protein
MDSWQDVFSTVTGLIGAFAAVVTLPGLTRRARLTRQLRRSLELAELLKGKPDLDAAREVLLRRARRAATVLRPIDMAQLTYPVQSWTATTAVVAGGLWAVGVLVLVVQAVSSPFEDRWLTRLPTTDAFTLPFTLLPFVLIVAGVALRRWTLREHRARVAAILVQVAKQRATLVMVQAWASIVMSSSLIFLVFVPLTLWSINDGLAHLAAYLAVGASLLTLVGGVTALLCHWAMREYAFARIDDVDGSQPHSTAAVSLPSSLQPHA